MSAVRWEWRWSGDLSLTRTLIDSRPEGHLVVLNAIEEVLEMSGIVVFVNGLRSYLNLHVEAGEVSNSVSGACAGLSGGGNEGQVMKARGKQFARDPKCERKRLHTLCGVVGGVSGLSVPRALQGAVDMAALGSAEREGGDGLNTIAGKVRIERLAIERVAGDNKGNVAIDGAGTGRCGPSNSTLQVLPCESRQRTVHISGLVHETCERRYRGTR